MNKRTKKNLSSLEIKLLSRLEKIVDNHKPNDRIAFDSVSTQEEIVAYETLVEKKLAIFDDNAYTLNVSYK